jgi:lyso-ornithine lipid O-acyltransferase
MSLTHHTADMHQGIEGLVFHGWAMRVLARLRATVLLASFLAITLPLMLVQYVLLKLNLSQARTLPHAYHKLIAKVLGIRVHILGTVAPGKPALLVCNHISWLDIIALSTVAPLSFVAKAEVSKWPFFSLLAKLQRTVFVDRTRRTLVKQKSGEIAERLAKGDNIVLFAEGTSSDGNRVLPFRSALFSAAEAANGSGAAANVHTVVITYTHLHGLPIQRHDRPMIAWYGEMDMVSHVWTVLKRGPLDVTISISEPVALESLSGRKELAAFSEARIRADFTERLTSRPRAE